MSVPLGSLDLIASNDGLVVVRIQHGDRPDSFNPQSLVSTLWRELGMRRLIAVSDPTIDSGIELVHDGRGLFLGYRITDSTFSLPADSGDADSLVPPPQ